MNEKNIAIAACCIWNEENKRDGPSGLETMGLGRFKLDSTPIRHKVLHTAISRCVQTFLL